MKWLVLLLFPLQVIAGEATLSWTAPTQNTDGTALTDLDGYKIYSSQQQGGPYSFVVDVRNSGTTSYVVQDLTPGTWYFVSTAYNDAGIESNHSNEASKTIEPPAPNPPTNLTVAADNLVAYGISQTKDRLVTYPVGEVAPGTPCDGSMSANGKYLVPFDAVTWAGTAKPVVVLAECSGG